MLLYPICLSLFPPRNKHNEWSSGINCGWQKQNSDKAAHIDDSAKLGGLRGKKRPNQRFFILELSL